MVKELASSKSGIPTCRKLHLQGFNLGIAHEVVRCPVTAGRRGKLTRKDCGSRRRTENSSRVSIRKIHSTRSKLIDVRRQCARSRSQAPDPIVHIVHREEQDVGTLSEFSRFRVMNKRTGNQDVKKG
jgi:hypothetical protein